MMRMLNVITFQWQSEFEHNYWQKLDSNLKFLFTFCSVPKNKRRKNNNRRIDGRDRGAGDYYGEASPVAGASSSRHQHRDVRYSDMAPK